MDDCYIALIPYDLQFFAEGEGGEKTEPATQKKLTDARKEGKVAQSKELSAGISLVAFFLGLRVFFSFVGDRFQEVFTWVYSIIPDIVAMSPGGLSIGTFSGFFQQVLVDLLIILLPFLVIGFVVAFIAGVIQVGWKPTTKPLEPKLDRFNPVNGFKRMFSKEALFNLFLSILKIILIFYVAYICIRDQAGNLFILYEVSLNSALSLIFQIIFDTGFKISLIYLLLGFVDYGYQRWKFSNDMKMTKQEVKDEYKNTEGDPTIKGQQRKRMQEASQRRMMKSVPEADVVITNPTHIAVAIKYDNTVDEAPKVLAKGEDYLAGKIKEAAKEAKVPIVENKPLARAIYATVEIGELIPPELYQAVAEILAVVYTNRAG